jgi:hypothetical protein
VGRQRDHLGLDGGELEHGWAGAVEIDAERPNTGLGSDSGFRKWAVVGIAGAGVLTAALVLLSNRDATPVDAVESTPSDPPVVSEVEPAPTPVEPTIVEPVTTLAIAPTPTVVNRPEAAPVHKAPPPPRVEPPDPAATTFANGSPAAAQPKPPAAAPKPTPATTPTPAPAPKPAPAEAPEQLEGEPLPSLAPEPDELPNVEGWDDADEAAREEAPS